MANADEILAVLEACGRAYPNQAISKATAELYVRSLADIPGGLLWQAAERHIFESVYFLRIAQLRGMATQLAGTPRFDCLPPGRFDNAGSACFDFAPLPLRSSQGFGSARLGKAQGGGLEGDELACQALEDAFYEERTLDPAAWLALAEAFEQADRPHRAEYTRRKLARLQAVLEAEAVTAEPIVIV